MHTCTLAALGASLACALLAAPLSPQDNILILLADDVGVDCIGAYHRGAAPPPTPNIDALARRGVLFRNAWANPKCSPTRACIQTGRYSFRTGVGTAILGTGSDPELPPQAVLPLRELTFAELIRSETSLIALGAIGKWHLGDASNGGPLAPNLAGWDHFSGLLYAACDYFNWPRCVNGVSAISTTYATTQMVDDALAWMRAAPEPWVCYLAFNAAHSPFHVPPPALHTRSLPPVPPHTRPTPFFKAAVEAMDTEIGRLLTSLAPDVLARTNVFFLADNGTPGLVTQPPFPSTHGKTTPYEGGVNVPLIVAGPAVTAPGREHRGLVGAVDLYATVIELCGLNPTFPGITSDSVSFLRLLRDPAAAPARQTVYAEAFDPKRLTTSGFATIRNGRYKLIRFFEKEAWHDELYDLAQDPFESDDLLARPLNVEQTFNYASLASSLVALRSS